LELGLGLELELVELGRDRENKEGMRVGEGVVVAAILAKGEAMVLVPEEKDRAGDRKGGAEIDAEEETDVVGDEDEDGAE
jgi:hypothetical protein